MDKAIELLRSRIAKAAVKREGNETAEGRIGIFVEPAAETAAIVEMRCESAPSAKSDQFIELAYDIARQVASAAPETVPQLLAQPYASGTGTVQDRINEVVGLIREKMIVHRFERLKAPVYGHYVHHDGTRRGAARPAPASRPARPTRRCGTCAAHAAALNPQYLDRRRRAGRRAGQGEGASRDRADQGRPEERRQAGEHHREDRRGQAEDVAGRDRC